MSPWWILPRDNYHHRLKRLWVASRDTRYGSAKPCMEWDWIATQPMCLDNLAIWRSMSPLVLAFDSYTSTCFQNSGDALIYFELVVDTVFVCFSRAFQIHFPARTSSKPVLDLSDLQMTTAVAIASVQRAFRHFFAFHWRLCAVIASLLHNLWLCGKMMWCEVTWGDMMWHDVTWCTMIWHEWMLMGL